MSGPEGTSPRDGALLAPPATHSPGRGGADAPYRRGLHGYAVTVAAATGCLLFVGGLVTSTGSGLAVPDWPLSFGQVFPRMTGGVLFEHGHRLVASTVGLLTVILAVWLARAEPRRWVRRLGVWALVAVLVQGALGGATVLLKLPVAVSVAHAGVAEIFFCLTVTIALATSRGWLGAPEGATDAGTPSLATLSGITVAIVYVQILVGALVRHSGAGLAIPDFPLSFGRLVPPLTSSLVLYAFAHRVGALAASVFVLWTAGRILRRHAAEPGLRRPALLLVALLAFQIFLGAAIIWTRKAVVPTTTHVVGGALILVTSLVITLRARRHRPAMATGAASAAAA
jgi:cytochrome c oxidase assembly protein subunit 15